MAGARNTSTNAMKLSHAGRSFRINAMMLKMAEQMLPDVEVIRKIPMAPKPSLPPSLAVAAYANSTDTPVHNRDITQNSARFGGRAFVRYPGIFLMA